MTASNPVQSLTEAVVLKYLQEQAEFCSGSCPPGLADVMLAPSCVETLWIQWEQSILTALHELLGLLVAGTIEMVNIPMYL